MNNRARLLTTIFEQGFRTPDHRHNVPPPIVTIEEFFEGNTAPLSIAPNLDGEPGREFFYEKLKAIRSREDVREVWLNIYDLSSLIHGDENGWPMAENVHILTSAAESTVQAWGEELHSDGAIEGWPYGQAALATPASDGFRWWALAWD
jgi:hypothetical protein